MCLAELGEHNTTNWVLCEDCDEIDEEDLQ